eukprot:SAG31_NODE_8702_length_1402_cov_3.338450_2_plen_89_part_00
MASTNKYYDGSKILTKEEVTQMFVEAMGDDGKRTHDDGELWAHSQARFWIAVANRDGEEFTRKFWCQHITLILDKCLQFPCRPRHTTK